MPHKFQLKNFRLAASGGSPRWREKSAKLIEYLYKAKQQQRTSVGLYRTVANFFSVCRNSFFRRCRQLQTPTRSCSSCSSCTKQKIWCADFFCCCCWSCTALYSCSFQQFISECALINCSIQIAASTNTGNNSVSVCSTIFVCVF